MKRLSLPVLACVIVLAGCGGSTQPTQHAYHTAYGEQAHSPTFGLPPHNLKLLPATSTAPTVEMYDAVTLSNIPPKPRVLAGYTSGTWPTYLKLVADYPAAKVKSVAINAGNHAMCLDVEPEDAIPSQVVAWIRADQAAGFSRPCVYSSLSEWAQIHGDLTAAHISRTSYFAWDADWTYVQHLDAGYDATQWTDHSGAKSLDESSVTLAFAGITPPKPKPSKPVCFGKHAQLTNATCKTVRPETSKWSHARAATGRALTRNSCTKPYRRPICRELGQRWNWFNSKAKNTVKEYS